MPGVLKDAANGSDIVISGMSGRFPESDSIEELAQNLYNNVDLVTDDARRWPSGYQGLPTRMGKLKDLSRLDASYFGIHGKQAHAMDPQQRMLLEPTFEAIVDAGFNPAELRGSRTGVFVGACFAESEDLWNRDLDAIDGYALTGICRGLFANRISYSFDLRGPSYTADTACSSSMTALAAAVNSMRNGQCDAAVVAGTNVCLKPTTSLAFLNLNMLSLKGRCAAFDESAQGYVRAEAIVVVLLQRREHARRVYATIHGAGLNADGYKQGGITFPNGETQRQLAEETFKTAGLHPQDVAYLEAHGTGTKVGDPEELNAIADFFCKQRSTPLLIGSVKSNMGHTESASGLCAIAKILIAMENGIIPANLHYKTPNPDIPALSDGRFQVVDRNTPWEGGLVAVNSFGFGGANVHVILESERGPLRSTGSAGTVPRLVVASGRTAAGVRRMLALAAAHPTRPELHALLDTVHAQNIVGHAHRGYTLLHHELDAPQEHVAELESGPPRPVWFVFSGMGSQWAGMARALLQLPVFAESVQRSAAVLHPYDIDLLHVLTDAPEAAFDNIINSFVAIAAVQIALVDVLRTVGITPDGMIGHSVGELGCAYADDTITAEQMMLSAYWRGRSVVDAKLAPGAMAAVGLTWEQCEEKCPAGVYPACHNSTTNVTVSGPVDAIEAFIKQLNEEGVFARRVKVEGAFHSKYIADVAPLLRRNMEQIIPNPKPRSARWISTSVLNNSGNSELGKMSDAEYMVNNLLSPVRFAEALRLVPARAVLVELAPHALLQAVLKRTLPGAAHVPLLRRDHPDQVAHLLAALGKMYCVGAQPQVARLYPAVQFPVPRGTPGLASSVDWDHTTEWSVAYYGSSCDAGETLIHFDHTLPDKTFVTGHKIDGRVLFPATGYLYLVWKTWSRLTKQKMEETPIVMENVEFRRATILSSESSSVKFLIRILQGGEFQVCEGGSVTVTGTVRQADESETKRPMQPTSCPELTHSDQLPLNTDDIYKELHLRGYNYTGVFRGILTSDALATTGTLAWNDNWISFIDTMLQFSLLRVDMRELYLPTGLLRVCIDPVAHNAAISAAGESSIPVFCDGDTLVSGGVEMRGIKKGLAPRRANTQAPPKLEKYVFLPYDNAAVTPSEDISHSKQNALTVSMQVIFENVGSLRIKLAEAALERPPEDLLIPHVLEILEIEPLVRVEASIFAVTKTTSYATAMQEFGVKVQMAADGESHVVLCSNVISSHDENILTKLLGALSPQGLLLLEEPCGTIDKPTARALLQSTRLELVSRQVAAGCEYLLLRHTASLPPAAGTVVLEIPDDDSYAWLEPLRVALQRAETEPLRVYAVARSPTSGLLGLGTCLRAEPGGHALRIYFLPGEQNIFTPDAPTFAAQVRKDLAVNVLRDGLWGSYRHLPIAHTLQSQIQVEHAFANTLTRGDLSSLRWIESDLRYAGEVPEPNTELVNVYYAPLNFKDIMLATGRLSADSVPANLVGKDCILGLEFSGRTSSGKRVMGMVPARGLATTVQADKGFLLEVPAAWSLEEAATVPVVYATAYYALVVRGCMARGEAVLVHAGSGGVGQAAIAIALHAGCTVYTTVGTPEKREFLLKRFPELIEENIGSSRNTSFEKLILQRTNGRGVDLVLNSLAGDMLQASVRCLANGGRFLEIGKLDLSLNTKMGMSIFLKNTTFHGVFLDEVFDANGSPIDKTTIVRCLSEGIASGVVRPLPTTVFSEQELEQAFRFMANGKHIGKVLVRVREEEALGAAPVTKLVSAIPRTYMHPGKSYVLVGGLGGFGLELGWWLVNRGARYLVVVGRGGVRSGYQAWCVRRWRARGVTVRVLAADAAAAGGARAILAAANQLAPIGGVFNLAAVLRDAFLENQTPEQFQAVTAPKIRGTQALDIATRELAPELEYFVVFSSVACGRGNAGQSNYGFANSSMERIVEQRQADGLPGLAIQWGAIGEVGLLAQMSRGEEAEVGGTLPQRISSCLDALGALLALPHAITASMVLADKRRAKQQPQQGLLQTIAKILGIQNLSQVSETTSFADFGIDSLMGAEIKQTLERGFDIVLTVPEIRALTFEKLKKMLGGASEVNIQNEIKVIDGDTEPDTMRLQLAQLSELMPKQVVVTLPTASAGEDAVFMVHPIEGVVDMLQTLAAGVRGRVLGLQCTREAPLDDMSSLARFYVQHVRAKQPRPPYMLLGYSFGAAVAFEMALQLQEIGCETKLLLVDGSPAFVAKQPIIGKKKREIRNAAKDEAEVLLYFARQIKDFDVSKVELELEQMDSWEARVASVAALVGAAPHEADALAAAAKSFYRKLVVADSYRPAAKLRAPVHLFTARDHFVLLGEDYGLREVCTGALSITQLSADHRSIITGDCAGIIAEYISNLL